MKILIKGKVEMVSVDRVKPAHFECKPETGTATKRKTQSKTTNSKTTGIVRGTRKDKVRSSSTLTQKSDRTRVKLTKNTQTQSTATKIGKNSATTPQHQAHRVYLPRQLTPYVAQHSRILALTGATAVCERIHMYPYTYGVKPLIHPERLKYRMLEIIRTSLIVTKLYRILSWLELDKKSILPHDSCRWSTL